ncbi:MAG: HAD family hydrolase [Bacillota bacterium]|nr:HAD family hydrolase [Bacillota bacterium]
MKVLQNKAIFLDRDGVVSLEKGYISSLEELEIYPFARQAVIKLKEAGWKVFIITNQSGVARGILTEKELNFIHQRLLEEIPVDKIYYCPHHPDGKAGSPYSIQCHCRKPEPGMIFRAARENHIDLSRSYLLGDRASDILAGKRSGLTTVLVRTGYGVRGLEQEVEPDYIFADLGEFVEYLMGERLDADYDDPPGVATLIVSFREHLFGEKRDNNV